MERIPVDEVDLALDRVDNIRTNAHETIDFLSAREANVEFDGEFAPHAEDSIVIDFEVQSPDTFWRVYDSSDDPAGPFVVRPDTIQNTNSKEEVLDDLGLLPQEFGVNYDRVAEVEIPGGEGITLRKSTVGEIESVETGESATGGATQYFAGGNRLQGFTDLGSIEELVN